MQISGMTGRISRNHASMVFICFTTSKSVIANVVDVYEISFVKKNFITILN
jgi:hypothetical protein